MKESVLRKLVLLLLLCAIVSVLWAVGANARKRVELEKSKNLDEKLEKLTRANTVIINDLKSTSNRLAEFQHKERMLKKELAIVLEKNEALQKPDNTPSEEPEPLNAELLQNETETLKATNTALGEEILKLKEKELALKQELEKLKTQATENKQTEKNPRRRPKKKAGKRVRVRRKNENKNSSSSSKNFSW